MNNRFSNTVILIFFLTNIFSQDTLRVLFLGNSYTSFNNLPQLVQNVSASAGKNLIVDSNMPGGFTISNHINDPTSMGKVSLGIWDYIVIQEQSQLPTIDFYRYNDMYPALADLKLFAEQFNPCTKIITYMTWGRRFGGQQCDPTNTFCSPVFADFNHMQDSLTSAYTQISDSLNIQCAPVGVTWQNILNDTNLILHATDNSHPNLDGSYVAALTIFSSIWKQTSNGISFNAGLTPLRAQYYQQQSDNTIFNNPNNWNLLINNPIANFSYSGTGNTINFTNLSSLSTNSILSYSWNFGDGNSSLNQNPSHTYSSSGTYTVSLIASNCIFSDTVTYVVQTNAIGIEENNTINFTTYPNPIQKDLYINCNKKNLGSSYLIISSTGENLFSGVLNDNTTKIEFDNLPTGIYFLRIDGNSNENRVIIKE